jgi:hypothetical protein
VRLFLAAAVLIAVFIPAAQAAQTPTRSQLPKMVLPDAALKRVASALPQRVAFFSTAAEGASTTPDPHDTAADVRRRGRIAGYVRGRSAPEALAARARSGLLAVGSSVILYRNASAAAASIQRDIAAGKRYTGKKVEGGLLVGYSAKSVPSLGRAAALLHIHGRPTGGTPDRFATHVVFLVRQLRGNATVNRADRTNADRLALDLAEQLRRRIVATLRHG